MTRQGIRQYNTNNYKWTEKKWWVLSLLCGNYLAFCCSVLSYFKTLDLDVICLAFSKDLSRSLDVVDIFEKSNKEDTFSNEKQLLTMVWSSITSKGTMGYMCLFTLCILWMNVPMYQHMNTPQVVALLTLKYCKRSNLAL